MIDFKHKLLKNTSNNMDLLDQNSTINLTMLKTHNLQSKHMVIPWNLMLQIIANLIPIKVKKNKGNLIQGTQPQKKNAINVAKKTISKGIVVSTATKFLKIILLQLLKNIILI